MYLLDTSIVSLFDPRRIGEAEPLVQWLRDRDSLLFLSTITVTEIEAGILKLSREGKNARAGQLIALRDSIVADFRDRLLSLDVEVALAMARLAEAIRPTVIDRFDLIIAATARVHGHTVLTRNLRHFQSTGVPAIDPTLSLPQGG